MSGEPQLFSYDALPYTGHVHPQAHPRRIAAMARLFGVAAADLADARVLDIGCGRGDDLLPLASAYPDARFVGIDLGERHIREASAIADRRGLSNIRFMQMDLTAMSPALGEFDYVIAHGIYSWVPDPVAAALLAACSRLLAPQGVAYISYNVLPGWAATGQVRDALRQHTSKLSSAPARVRAAREFLSGLAATAEPGSAPVPARIAARIENASDSYVFHEFLCEDNHPWHFRDFVGRARQYDLDYVGDVSAGAMWADGISREAVKQTAQFGDDRLAREETLDALTQRQFRHSLLCHAGLPVTSEPQASRLRGLALSTRLCARGNGHFADDDGRSIAVSGAATEAALSAVVRGGGRPVAYDPDWEGLGAGQEVAEDLMALVRAGLLEVVARGTPCASRVERFPLAFSHARADVVEGATRCVGLGHRTVDLDPLAVLLLPLLDGSRDRADLAAELAAAIGRGAVTAAAPGGEPISASQLPALIEAWLDEALARELLLAPLG